MARWRLVFFPSRRAGRSAPKRVSGSFLGAELEPKDSSVEGRRCFQVVEVEPHSLEANATPRGGHRRRLTRADEGTAPSANTSQDATSYSSWQMSAVSAPVRCSRSDVATRTDRSCEPASNTTMSRSTSRVSTTTRSRREPASGGTAPSSNSG